MQHSRPPGRARTAMRTITHRDMGLTLQQAVHAGLNVDWSDLEEFFGDASADSNLWVTVCKMLKAEDYQGLALKAANVTHIGEVKTVELAKVARKRATRRVVRKRPIYTIDDFKGAPVLHGVWLYHGQPKDNRANVTLY
jgi:hypothetical protein